MISTMTDETKVVVVAEEVEDEDEIGILSAARVEKDLSLYDRQEGNSSDEEDATSVHVDEIDISVTEKDEGEDGGEIGGYEALQEEEEFGDFHGFDKEEDDRKLKANVDSSDQESFANFYGSRCQKDLQKSPHPVQKQVTTEKKLADNIAIPQHLSIPPLSQGKAFV